MARRLRNIVKGGGKKFDVEGFKELRAKLQDMLPDSPGMRVDINKVLGDGATVVRDEMRAQAAAAQWPARLIATIFKYSELAADYDRRHKKISALAGVSKKRSMFEWTAGKHPRHERKDGTAIDIKRAPGEKVAMSLAHVWEFGSSKFSAHPAIRPAIKSVRGKVREAVMRGFKTIYEMYTE